MSWQNDLSKRLISGREYSIDGMKVKLLESPRGVSGYGGHGGAIFLSCEILEDYDERYTKGSRHNLNSEFLR
tara:strand:- start:410 stop:625 length:216 start_codon:yes stop_codon:yes gene_type:complete